MSSRKKTKKSPRTITVDIASVSDSALSEDDGAREEIIIFTDGSCSGNGRSDALGGIGIYFPNGELPSVSKIFPLDGCTNQRAELYAILSALRYAKSHIDMRAYKICIKTDSDYSINCLTKWVKGWMKNGWTKQDGYPVQNKELIETIYKYVNKYGVKFRHVAAHTGRKDPDSLGNAEADRLATTATKLAMEKRGGTISRTDKRFVKSPDRKSNAKSGSKSNKKTTQIRTRSAAKTGDASKSKPKVTSKPKAPPKPKTLPKTLPKTRASSAALNSKYSADLVVELVKNPK